MHNSINNFLYNLLPKSSGLSTSAPWVLVSKKVGRVAKTIPLNNLAREEHYLVQQISLFIASLIVGYICFKIISVAFRCLSRVVFSSKKPPPPPSQNIANPQSIANNPQHQSPPPFQLIGSLYSQHPEPYRKLVLTGNEAEIFFQQYTPSEKRNKKIDEFKELTVKSCNLSSLPNGLSVEHLILSEVNLEEISSDLKVKHLDLNNSQITKIECPLNVLRLLLNDLPILEHIPPNIIPTDCLCIKNCRELQLPPGLRLKRLELQSLANLQALPADLQVETLIIRSCPITQLPQQLKVERLFLMDCPIENIPPDLQVERLIIRSCPITQLPQQLKVGRLFLMDCPIENIPPDLIFTELSITRCNRLSTIPASVQVKKDLHIIDCNSFNGLPEHPMTIGGNISLHGCINMNSIPRWIRDLGPLLDDKRNTLGERRVSFTVTAHLEQIIRNLQSENAFGIQFFFSMQAAKVEEKFETLQEALDFWGKLGVKSVDASSLNFRDDQTQDAIQFLQRMVNTAEYKREAIRPYLAQRLIDVFQAISQDHEIQERALSSMHNALASCDDRIIAGLDELELMIAIDNLEKADLSEAQLKEQGRRYLLLDMVYKAAENHKNTLTWIDEVEIHLAFRIGLAERFNLPINTRNMIFDNMAQITPEQLQAIGDEIERECTSDKLGKFLETWSPWIKSERKRQAVPYDELPFDEKYFPEQNDICVFTQTKYPEIEEPVVYDDIQLYDYCPFRKWYISGGTNPLRQNEPINWALVKRIQKYQSVRSRRA